MIKLHSNSSVYRSQCPLHDQGPFRHTFEFPLPDPPSACLPPRFRLECRHRGRAVGEETTEFAVHRSPRNPPEHGGTLPRHGLLVLGLRVSRLVLKTGQNSITG